MKEQIEVLNKVRAAARRRNEHSRTPYGYSAIQNVNLVGPANLRDEQESFFLAETLKYLYLATHPSPEKLLPLSGLPPLRPKEH